MDAKKIKKAMIDLDLSMAELAARAGYTRQHVARVLYGRYRSLQAEQRIMMVLRLAQRGRRAA